MVRAQVEQARQMVPLLSFLVNQTALAALVFGLWRLGVDLGVTGQFLIAQGLFSHWQVWLLCAAALKMTATSLNRTVGPADSPK